MARLVHIVGTGAGICDRCARQTTGHRGELHYDDGSTAAVCVKCWTPEEQSVADESFRIGADQLAAQIEVRRQQVLGFPADDPDVQDTQRILAEAAAKLKALNRDDEKG